MGQTAATARQGVAVSMRVTVERGRKWLIFRFPPPTCQAEVDQLDRWRQVRQKIVSTAFAGRPATVYVRLPQHEDLSEVLHMPAVLHTVDNAQYQLFSQDCLEESRLNDVTDSLGFELASMWIEGREDPSSVDPVPLSRFAPKPLGASGQNVKGAEGEEEGGNVKLEEKGNLGQEETAGNMGQGKTRSSGQERIGTSEQAEIGNFEQGDKESLGQEAVGEGWEAARIREVITAAEKCDTEEGVPETSREVCVCVADGTILCWLNPREERRESVLQAVKDLTNEQGLELEECDGANAAIP